MFNWKVANPHTQRSYQTAISEFEATTSLPVDRADAAALAIYHRSMEARGLSINTIRTRLAAIRLLSGVSYPIPPKQKSGMKLLDADQVHALINVMDSSERSALLRQLTGMHTPSLKPAADFMAHFMGMQQTAYTAQDLTRKLKRCARQAGIEADQVSLRVWRESGKRLLNTMDPTEFINLLGKTDSASTSNRVEWKKVGLHRIGRRSFLKA